MERENMEYRSDDLKELQKRISDLETEIIKFQGINIINHRSIEIGKLASALSKAQSEMEDAYFNRIGYQKNNYANLYATIKATRPFFKNHGLAVTQNIITEPDGKSYIYTELLHESGQWTSSKVLLRPFSEKGDGNQDFGKAITYMQRYSFKSLVGVIADDFEDDDSGGDVMPDKNPNQAFKQSTIEYISHDQIQMLVHELDGHPDVVHALYKSGKVSSFSEIRRDNFQAALEFARRNVAAKNNQGK
jgi:hypothetical protein